MPSPGEIALSVGLFIVAGVFEIGGGWLVWQTIRENRPWWWAVLGAVGLVCYGLVSCYQPETGDGGTSEFARVYAVYGGYFIVLAVLWGWVVDKERPDVGDAVGASIAIAGALTMYLWPRTKTEA